MEKKVIDVKHLECCEKCGLLIDGLALSCYSSFFGDIVKAIEKGNRPKDVYEEMFKQGFFPIYEYRCIDCSKTSISYMYFAKKKR